MDFDALSFAAANGRAIFVESRERAAPHIDGLTAVQSIEELSLVLMREARLAGGSGETGHEASRHP